MKLSSSVCILLTRVTGSDWKNGIVCMSGRKRLPYKSSLAQSQSSVRRNSARILFLKESAFVIVASGQDAFRTSSRQDAVGNWKEAQGHKYNMLQRLYISPGLAKPSLLRITELGDWRRKKTWFVIFLIGLLLRWHRKKKVRTIYIFDSKCFYLSETV